MFIFHKSWVKRLEAKSRDRDGLSPIGRGRRGFRLEGGWIRKLFKRQHPHYPQTHPKTGESKFEHSEILRAYSAPWPPTASWGRLRGEGWSWPRPDGKKPGAAISWDHGNDIYSSAGYLGTVKAFSQILPLSTPTTFYRWGKGASKMETVWVKIMQFVELDFPK